MFTAIKSCRGGNYDVLLIAAETEEEAYYILTQEFDDNCLYWFIYPVNFGEGYKSKKIACVHEHYD